MDEDLFKEFKKWCVDRNLVFSYALENLIKKELKQEEKSKE